MRSEISRLLVDQQQVEGLPDAHHLGPQLLAAAEDLEHPTGEVEEARFVSFSPKRAVLSAQLRMSETRPE